MNKRLCLTLIASTAFTASAMAQSSGTTSPADAADKLKTPTVQSDNTASNSGSSNTVSPSTGASESGTTASSNPATQNPNPNIYGNTGNPQYGGNNGQFGGGDSRFAQQNQQSYGNFGQGMAPWAYGGGGYQAMNSAGFGGSMVCVSPAPGSGGMMGMAGSFACYPAQQQMGQNNFGGMNGFGGMNNPGPYGGQQQMGQYGFGNSPYGGYSGNFDYNQNRYGWDQGYFNPYGGNGSNFNGQYRYGSSMGFGNNDSRYGYGSRSGNFEPGPTSPNWYYENRQRQAGRNYVPGFDSGNYGSNEFDRNYNYDRRNQFNEDVTGSTSRPDRRFDDQNTGSSQRYHDDRYNDNRSNPD